MKKTILAIIGLLFFLPACSLVSEYSVGGGTVSPHSESNNEQLQRGLALHFNCETPLEKWVNAGVGYIYANYDETDNTAYRSKNVNSHTGWLYFRPHYDWDRFSLFFRAGPGFNLTDSDSSPAAVIAPGIGFRLFDSWEFQASFLYLWGDDHIYKMPTAYKVYRP